MVSSADKNVRPTNSIPDNAQTIVIPHCELGSDIRLGQLVFELNDTEMLGYRESHRHFKKGETVRAERI